MQPAVRWSLSAAALALCGALFLPLPIGSADLSSHTAELTELSGLQVSEPAQLWLTVLPAPKISFSGLALKSADGVAVGKIERIETRLRLLPLIAGRFEPAAAQIINPTLHWDASFAPAAKQAAARPSPPTFPVSVSGGKLSLGSGAQAIALEDVALSLAWGAPEAAAALRGSAAWREERFQFSALLGRPGELNAGRESAFTLQLASPAGELIADGELAALPRWQFNGALKASARQPHRLVQLSGFGPAWPQGIANAALQGALRINANTISFASARLELGEASLTGSLALQNDEGKPRLVGTLAANALSFSPRPGWLSGLDSPEGRWSSAPLPIEALSAFNMDLRLSTASLKLGQTQLGDVAVTSNVQDGRAELTLSSGQAYGGALKARVGANVTGSTPQLRAQANFDNVEAGAFMRDAFGSARLNGYASGELDLRLSGASAQQMAQSAAGLIRLTAGAGALAGVDFERAMRQSQTQPLSLPAALRSGGRTPFRRAQVNGLIQDGLIRLSRSQVETDAASIALAGAISLPERSFAIDIDALRSESNASDERPRAVLKLDLTGPWSSPSLRLDAEALIENSPAAAPLKRMLRNLSTSSPAASPSP